MSELRNHFAYWANQIVEQEQTAQEISPRKSVSLRLPFTLVAEIDALADRYGVTRQSIIQEILENTVPEVIGGMLDGFGKDEYPDFAEKVHDRTQQFVTEWEEPK